ncbi:AAA family ATPase [Novosphingopyxis iocasae]|uniref:AAA family ATPase n=1 Tax=Novosphingopyxis iocasae TaxID=2762729 RepID=UPI001650DEE8|nr:AAA family ATPase [Novosphingopyxis iocasae]
MQNSPVAPVAQDAPHLPSGVDAALHAASFGWRVLPIVPGRKIPYSTTATAAALGVDPTGPAGVHHARSDEASIRALWAGERAGAWIGLAMGDGRLAIDIDERDGKSGSASMAAKGWTISASAMQRTPSGGSHILVDVPAGQPAPTDTLASGLDRRGDGGFLVLYDPAILSAPRATAPQWATAGADRTSARIAPGTGQRAPAYQVALDALRSRDPSDMGRDVWLLFSGAFYAAVAGLADNCTALADWLDWCEGHGEKNDPAANRRAWADFARHGTGGDFRTLGRMSEDANAAGWAAFGGIMPPLPPGARLTRAANDPAALFVRVADMVARPPVFLIDGLLEEDALASLFGDPASGKSLVAIDMAACVATGEAFHGHRVASGPVFYIAGEGKNGLRRRFAGWEELRGVSIAEAPLFASTAAVQFLDGPSATMATAAIDALAAQHGTPRLIVIDTLARNFGPGDENSTADMNAFVAALDRLRERYPCSAVLLVHHSGHGEKTRGRGSSVLRGAVDTEYRVEKKGEAVTLSNSKMKDAPPPRAMQFELVEAAGSVALEFTGEPDGSGGGLTPTARMGMEAFAAVAVDGAASEQGWRAAFYERHDSEKPETLKRAFHRARTALIDGRQIVQSGENYSRMPMPGLVER